MEKLGVWSLEPGERKDIDLGHVLSVESGTLAQYIDDGRNKPVIIFFWGPGNFILPPAGNDHDHFLKAMNLTQLRMIRQNNLPNGSIEKQRFKNQVYSQSHRAALLKMDAFERVKWFLKMLHKENGNARFELPMTRMEIGSHLGLTFETVSRNFSKLKTQGLIKFNKPNLITVINLD